MGMEGAVATAPYGWFYNSIIFCRVLLPQHLYTFKTFGNPNYKQYEDRE